MEAGSGIHPGFRNTTSAAELMWGSPGGHCGLRLHACRWNIARKALLGCVKLYAPSKTTRGHELSHWEQWALLSKHHRSGRLSKVRHIKAHPEEIALYSTILMFRTESSGKCLFWE